MIVTHIEAVVASKQHPVGAGKLDQETKLGNRMRDRIVIKPPHVLSDGTFYLAIILRLDRLPACLSTGDRGDSAAGVRKHDIQASTPIEHTAEYERGRSRPGVIGIAQKIGQV